MRRVPLVLLLCASIAAVCAIAVWFVFRPTPDRTEEVPARAQVALQVVAEGFQRPVKVVRGPAGSNELYVLEQGGRIFVLDLDQPTPRPFLDLTEYVIGEAFEQGLYALAFDPDYARTRTFYVGYTSHPHGHVTLSRFRLQADGTVASPQVLLEAPGATPGHHGLDLHFGPDGLLYMSLGDGQLTGRSLVSQDLGNLRGKVLRIDPRQGDGYDIPPDNPFVGVRGARPEIWAYGFRNPYRFSFDPVEGMLWLGDVGNNMVEEIDVVERGGNYGWPLAEGREKRFRAMVGHLVSDGRILGVMRVVSQELFMPSRRAEPPVTDYLHLQYDRTGGNSVVGGLVYRGEAIPALYGAYLFGDWASSRIWALEVEGGKSEVSTLLEGAGQVSSFGADEEDEIYVTDFGRGAVLKLVAADVAANGTSGSD